jgi:predicted RNA-binding Zn-ribbon protein involved in translation (DUF1610 family)
MSDRCTTCHALLDEEDLFCPNCGAEAPQRDTAARPASRTATCNFVCEGCGASMSYDASAGTLRCPFCGSERLEKRPDKSSVSPEGVVPFVITREQATRILRDWLGRGFWRPGDLSEAAMIVSMTAVYVPYWVFTARTQTYWTADTDRVPAGASGDWCPLAGEHQGQSHGILVAASGVLRPSETAAIAPFDLRAAVPSAEVDLDNVTVEEFGLLRRYARPIAIQELETADREACAAYVPGRSRNVKVNVLVQGLSGRPLLLPTWILAYRYRDQVFRFLVNGQTGRCAGTAPWSAYKVGVVIGIVLLAVGLVAGIAILKSILR